jgi:23S rRNA (uracil1939-C5)-methyltransferase
MSKRRRKAPPTEEFNAHIRSLSHEGRGIATVEERTTFISNALPGEEVNFLYNKLSKKYAEGRAVEIVQASPERVTPKCDYFGLCGGCSLQHMDAQGQLDLKQSTLIEQLTHFAGTQAESILPPLLGPLYGYRNKARLGVRYVTKKESVLVGFREQQSRYLANMNHCEVLNPRVGQLITPLRELIMGLTVKEQIAQIEVAIGDDHVALMFRNLETLTAADREALSAFAQQHELWLFLQPNKPEPLEKLYPADNDFYLSYQHPDFDVTLWFHPTDFTQVNSEINKKMVAQAIDLLELNAEDEVLDLFCGLGNFTLPMSRAAKTVVGVEGSDTMVARAQMNAERNDITNTEFYAADLCKDIDQAWIKRRYSKVLLDPARSGALEILPHLATWQPERIVYVSCNPATLARDIGEITKYGYKLLQAGIMDMFPQTSHVESMAVLVKVK